MRIIITFSILILSCFYLDAQYDQEPQEKPEPSLVTTLNKHVKRSHDHSCLKAVGYAAGAGLLSIVPYQATKVLYKTVPQHLETVRHHPKAIPTIVLTITWDIFTAGVALLSGYYALKFLRTSLETIKEQK